MLHLFFAVATLASTEGELEFRCAMNFARFSPGANIDSALDARRENLIQGYLRLQEAIKSPENSIRVDLFAGRHLDEAEKFLAENGVAVKRVALDVERKIYGLEITPGQNSNALTRVVTGIHRAHGTKVIYSPHLTAASGNLAGFAENKIMVPLSAVLHLVPDVFFLHEARHSMFQNIQRARESGFHVVARSYTSPFSEKSKYYSTFMTLEEISTYARDMKNLANIMTEARKRSASEAELMRMRQVAAGHLEVYQSVLLNGEVITDEAIGLLQKAMVTDVGSRTMRYNPEGALRSIHLSPSALIKEESGKFVLRLHFMTHLIEHEIPRPSWWADASIPEKIPELVALESKLQGMRRLSQRISPEVEKISRWIDPEGKISVSEEAFERALRAVNSTVARGEAGLR